MPYPLVATSLAPRRRRAAARWRRGGRVVLLPYRLRLLHVAPRTNGLCRFAVSHEYLPSTIVIHVDRYAAKGAALDVVAVNVVKVNHAIALPRFCAVICAALFCAL